MVIESGGAEGSSRKRILAGAIGVAAFVALVFLAIQGFQYLRRPLTAAQLEAQMDRQPETREAFRALRHHYPHDADAFYQRAAAAANAGGVEAAERAAFLFMQQFMRSKAGAIARGSSATLNRIASEYSALLHVLRTGDVRICAQFSMTGLNPGQTPPPQSTEHFNRIVALQIEAAHEGEAKDAPPRTAPSEANQRSWMAEIRAIDPSLQPLLADSHALDAAPAARQCDVGVAIYDAAAALPAEPSASITAYLVRSSLEERDAPEPANNAPRQSPGRSNRPNQKDIIR
jgi:hypothetical protein